MSKWREAFRREAAERWPEHAEGAFGAIGTIVSGMDSQKEGPSTPIGTIVTIGTGMGTSADRPNYVEDNSANSDNRSERNAGERAHSAEAREAQIARWLCDNPPQGIDPDRCAACGQPYIDDFVTLMDGAIVHYDGMYGDRCFRLYQEQRRAKAEAALARSTPEQVVGKGSN